MEASATASTNASGPRDRPFHFPALDGARALAVAAVMVFHLDSDLASGGFIGVDVFFVLSGVLITGLLLRERGRTGGVRLGSFYARRALRLYPALVVACALGVVLSITVLHTSRDAVWSTLMSLGYVTDFLAPMVGHVGLMGHTWSLGVEEQFYLLWPVALLWLAHRRRETTGTLAIGAVCAALTALLWPAQGHDSYFMPWTHFTELLVGAFVAQLWTTGRLRLPSALAWPALLVIMAAVFTVPDMFWRPLYFGGWLVLAVCSATVVAVLVTQPDSPLTKVLSTRLARWVGQRSYGIYLYSAPITYVIVERNAFGRVSVNGAVMIAATVALAAISYRFIETPFLRVKARFEVAPTG